MSGAVESSEGLRRFRPYAAYADSGVPDLGSIPVGWSAQRLASIGTFSASGIDKKSIDGEVAVRMANYTDVYGSQSKTLDGSIEFMRVTCLPEKQRTHSLLAGDILFTPSSETPEEIGFSAVVTEDLPDTVYSYHLIRLRRHRGVSLDLSFSKYFCNNVAVLRQFSRACKGTTRQILTREDFRNIRVALPTLDEQRAIAEFLDRETGKIDALVAKKERLIDLFEEKRTALITRAVTQGLDPTAPTKPSGIDWLGYIPAHWEVKSNRSLFRDVDRRSSTGEEELLTVSHLTGVTRRSEKNVTMIEAESHEGYKICEEGELVINTLWGWMGALGIAWERGIVSPAYNVYRLNETMLPRFVDYYCRTRANVCDITRHSKGVWKSRLRIYPEDFREVLTVVPPCSEQEEIADHLDRELCGMDALAKKIGEGLERLSEFRTALISAAVTGKIDVLEEVA